MTFKTKEATALELNMCKNPRVKRHTGFHLNATCLESRVLKDISSTHHIFQKAEKKISLYRQSRHN
jgi:hypothetical protein